MRLRGRGRPAPPGPQALGALDGLAYALYAPDEPARGGVVIIHGAGSCKERHFDFARVLRSHGLAAVVFDQRGHGASEGRLGWGAIDDIAQMAELLPPGPLGLRGSSMGGYLALVAAQDVGARAVVAICPAKAASLLRALRADSLPFDVDAVGLERLLLERDEAVALASLRAPLLLMHAEADEQVPVEHSRELLAAAGGTQKRLVVVPGGHHRSVQHDSELQALSLRFFDKAFART